MKALTLWRPWPWAIFHSPGNPKRIENRPWKPWLSLLNRQIVLHAGQYFDKAAVDDLLELVYGTPAATLPASATQLGLIGVATIHGWAESEEDCERFMTGQGEWFTGPYAWLLSDVRAFPEPIPCKGAQGLWDLPSWAEARVLGALP